MISFIDSASAPFIAQVKTAVSQGITAWAFYLAGPGAYNNWTPVQVDCLRQGGMSIGLPIYVPKIDLTTNPTVDARVFVNAMVAAGVYGVGALDTEASMRGNPFLHSYVDGFVAELRALGVTPVVYGGGDYVPAGVNAWWIIQGIPPAGEAYQWGSGSLVGIYVDYDTAGPGFPMAALTAPTPVPIEPTKEELMSVVVAPDGTRIIERVAPGGHLLVFERAPVTLVNPKPKWTVDDVTDEIAIQFPTLPPFLVQA